MRKAHPAAPVMLRIDTSSTAKTYPRRRSMAGTRVRLYPHYSEAQWRTWWGDRRNAAIALLRPTCPPLWRSWRAVGRNRRQPYCADPRVALAHASAPHSASPSMGEDGTPRA
jgi:hypothetical protein